MNGAPNPFTLVAPKGVAFTFHAMDGFEGISQLFVYELDVLSTRADVRPAEILDHPVTVQLALPGGDQQLHVWSARVASLQYLETGDDGLSRYRLTLRPWFWQLTLSADCRVFQNLSVPEIAAKIFQERGFADFESSLSETYPQHEYVMQYRETDFQFLSRWLAREGIYYFFRHEQGKHTLVLADSSMAHSNEPGGSTIRFAPPDVHRDATMPYVRRWRVEANVGTGTYSHADFDFTASRVTLYATAKSTDDFANPALRVYDNPGDFTSFTSGDGSARLRLDQSRREAQVSRGQTNATGLTVASTFTLSDHPREDQNQKYLVTSARYHLAAPAVSSGAYTDVAPFDCTFAVQDANVTFRPPLPPRPSVRGPQTATVVGPEGREIWTDEYGRVKVQFHWDRTGNRDENSSCWVRVAQVWAGSNWGAQFVPRIGHEVMVDFLDGDPDRPIVTGSVYNSSNMPPFSLPENQTQSGIRTRSSPGGTLVNGNEIRFEDLKGREDLFVQAERTQTTIIKDAQTVKIGASRFTEVALADSLTVGLTRSIHVGAANATTVGGSSTETVGAIRRVSVGGQNIATIAGSSVAKVGGDSLTQVAGVTRFDLNGALRVNAAGDESRTTGGKVDSRVGDTASYVYAASAKTVIGHPEREAPLSTFVYGTSSASASKDVTIQSDTSITLKVGDTTVVVKPDGVTINGKTLAWNAGSKLTVASPNASLALDDNFTAIGKNATLSSSGASLALDSAAKLTGSKVQLGSGGGSSASASSQSGKPADPEKPVYFRTKLIRHGKPAGGVSYKLVLDGVTTLSGSTTGAGLIEQKVPATVASVVLTLLDTGETKTLTISAIEPVTTVIGAQTRLKRLGFFHGVPDGELGDLTTHAVEMFQKAQGLQKTGALDAATQAALTSAYGS